MHVVYLLTHMESNNGTIVLVERSSSTNFHSTAPGLILKKLLDNFELVEFCDKPCTLDLQFGFHYKSPLTCRPIYSFNSRTSLFLPFSNEILLRPINLIDDIRQKFMVVTCCTLTEFN